jgi:formylglycine-generating enzyme required for sulfatase activity
MSLSPHELPQRVPGTLVNRADLLLAIARLPAKDWATAALECGFVQRPPGTKREERRGSAEPAPLPTSAPASELRVEPAASPAELRFLQAVSYQRFDVAVSKRPDEIGSQPIRDGQLRAAPYRIAPKPLQPWSRLWPYLHHVLGQYLPGRRIDLPRLVDQIARQQPVRGVPFRRRLAWASRVHILVDGSEAMHQFRDDIHGLLSRLRELRGSEGFCSRVIRVEPEPDRRRMEAKARSLSPGDSSTSEPDSGDTLLVFSDLGCLSGNAKRIDAWTGYGLHLQRKGVQRFALSPCPRDRWAAGLARVWACAPWDVHERLPYGRSGLRPGAAHLDGERRREMLEALLQACSVPLMVESALLRDMRLALPGADAGLEHDLRDHAEMNAAAGACALNHQHVNGRMDELAAEGGNEYVKRLREALPDLLRRHHRGHSARLIASETYNCLAAGLDVTEEELDEAQSVARAGNCARLEEIESAVAGQAPADRRGLGAWHSRELARKSFVRGAHDRELAAACALESLASGGTVECPEHIDMAAYRRTRYWGLRKQGGHHVWQLRQNGQNLELQPSSGSLLPGVTSAPPLAGSPLALVPAQTPSVSLTFRQKAELHNVDLRTDREEGRGCALASPDRIEVASDSCELVLEAREVPPWATRFGWDRYGLFADFEAAGATFAMRWIPPGEFMMGSPEDEPGRYDDAGPQHRVTIGRGFWLGETPVTQGQYAAVTGNRPSHFSHAGDRAPVEQVSWEDCREFCKGVAGKVRGAEAPLAFRLPSEAEWEYACRAGTNTALYTGPLTIEGERNGPELDAIAWYGGNSGVDYEGGVDSSDWPEKRREHNRAGTHPVGQKARNAWGLYDMLGNVYEWCEDVWQDNHEGAPDDGSARHGEGGGRVCRGGSWASDARYCRCACRNRWQPVDRNGYLGFRLVLAAQVNRGTSPFS